LIAEWQEVLSLDQASAGAAGSVIGSFSVIERQFRVANGHR